MLDVGEYLAASHKARLTTSSSRMIVPDITVGKAKYVRTNDDNRNFLLASSALCRSFGTVPIFGQPHTSEMSNTKIRDDIDDHNVS